MKLRIGSRGSALALCQTNMIAQNIRYYRPQLEIDIVKIKTKGDKVTDVPLAKIGDKGLFVKELEEAILDGRVDLAVHSLKDLPTNLPPGLTIGAITKREEARDALISRGGCSLKALPPGAAVGTSSLRRQAQLLHQYPHLRIVSLRGNLDTRIRKLTQDNLDAIIIAAAGVRRLGRESEITQLLPLEWMLPAVGQGALAIEVREEDIQGPGTYIRECLQIIHHLPTALSVYAERALLHHLEGGCQVPIGAYAELKDNKLRLQGMVASCDGKKLIRNELWGKPERPEALGEDLGRQLLDAGAQDILANIVRS